MRNVGLKQVRKKEIHINEANPVVLSFGLGNDLHHQTGSDDLPNGRYRTDGVQKLDAAIQVWNADYLSFVMMNGDYIDHKSGTFQEFQNDIAIIETKFDELEPSRYYTLGNHEMDVNTKADFMNAVGMPSNYYSFDIFGFHIVCLDGCYTADDDNADYANGNFVFTDTWINPAQRTWLTNDLASTTKPTIIFCHQRLDVTTNHSVKNASVVRTILENSGLVIGVFSGHFHNNSISTINEIPYYTLEAMTDQEFPANAFAIVRIKEDLSILVEGFGGQSNYP